MIVRSSFLCSAILLSLEVVVTTAAIAGSQTPFPDAHEKPPAGWPSHVFRLRQDYPAKPPTGESCPWDKHPLRTQWKEYLECVLRYCCEGNYQVDFDAYANMGNPNVRPWFHAPWMHAGRYGREFVHGLTYERVAMPQELSTTQTDLCQDWAVSLYNSAGGYVIGQMWKDHDHPNTKRVKFPVGTVSFKLLFTEASVAQAPFLAGTREWQANIFERTDATVDCDTKRTIRTVRLLQVDVAVRDKNAEKDGTGWVFGTFTYNKDYKNGSISVAPWCHLQPIGLMWGNDPKVTDSEIRKGMRLAQTVISDSPILPYQHLGWGGRLCGPVDDRFSSCLSCHSTAQDPMVSLIPDAGVQFDSKRWNHWFRNVNAGEPFERGDDSLDYSLQLATGLRNFKNSLLDSKSKPAAPFNRAGFQARSKLLSRE